MSICEILVPDPRAGVDHRYAALGPQLPEELFDLGPGLTGIRPPEFRLFRHHGKDGSNILLPAGIQYLFQCPTGRAAELKRGQASSVLRLRLLCPMLALSPCRPTGRQKRIAVAINLVHPVDALRVGDPAG